MEFCPRDVLEFSDQRNEAGFYPVVVKRPEQCTGCISCALMCPDACIEIYRIAVEESVNS
jgi:2-oxoglutarate ferredoxin oxidoreductase subunit delta